ncbi:MAG: Redoxin domain protein [Nocardioides sp.]|jgi:thiol-disulfide isomerase/thioredoxin|nr:Redoxin domain protein [Nocardioides sp.]MCW2842217.1 Redoxin domain protein [Nocardioides sp.]
MKGAGALVLAAALLVLTGCGPADVPAPGQAKVDVDTPRLREMKQAAGVEACSPGSASHVDGGLPALTLPCLGGGTAVDLATLKGPMVINLWQAYCGPCRTEMPALQDFYERYGDTVPVVGIDYLDVQPEAALKLVQKSGVTYPLLADPGGDLDRRDGFPPVLGLPYLVFVGADGSIFAQAGGVDSADELVDLVDKHLGVGL